MAAGVVRQRITGMRILVIRLLVQRVLDIQTPRSRGEIWETPHGTYSSSHENRLRRLDLVITQTKKCVSSRQVISR